MIPYRNPPSSRHHLSQLRKTRITCLVLFVVIVILLVGCIVKDRQIRELQSTEPTAEVPYIGRPTLCETPLVNVATDEPDEDTYFRDDIPLGIEEQKLLHDTCEEFEIPFSLALAVIEQETNYRNIAGDGGDSIGYMQIQPRWWRSKMDKLDAHDLTVPEDNFRVGCSILSDLLTTYGTEIDALTAYNTGRPGTSPYASSVLAICDRLEGVMSAAQQ